MGVQAAPTAPAVNESHVCLSGWRQLFWEKKLSGLNAFDIAEELVKTMDLPKGLQGNPGPRADGASPRLCFGPPDGPLEEQSTPGGAVGAGLTGLVSRGPGPQPRSCAVHGARRSCRCASGRPPVRGPGTKPKAGGQRPSRSPAGVGPGCTDETLLSAIASALHTSTMPITGQLSAAVEKNPGVWLNTAQPLCKAFMVTDEDIR